MLQEHGGAFNVLGDYFLDICPRVGLLGHMVVLCFLLDGLDPVGPSVVQIYLHTHTL